MDQNWYMDTGATDNITSDLEKPAVHDKYNGGDQIHTLKIIPLSLNFTLIIF